MCHEFLDVGVFYITYKLREVIEVAHLEPCALSNIVATGLHCSLEPLWLKTSIVLLQHIDEPIC
jgi:hypothetical protein